jgi:catechol 2,3-dioxygenase-like lactoylglutathione lyase family enzyme
VTDVEASTAFYSTIGPAAGLTLQRQAADGATFSLGVSDGFLLLIGDEPTGNVHVAFSGDDDDVRRFHADATQAGYRSNGEPGERPRYHAGYYAAFVLDPGGNSIEVVNHHRQRSHRLSAIADANALTSDGIAALRRALTGPETDKPTLPANPAAG